MTEAHQTPAESLSRTGERLVPELQHGELVHAEHLARYRLAAQLVPGRRVLDAASGEGYGAAILAASGAKSVTGVDIDSGSVEHSRARYALDFEVADVGALPFGEDSFDLVVSFETIEHVNDPSKALLEFRRVLTEDGTLVISTPNTHEYLVDNEFHVHEFAHEEFVALLKTTFSNVDVMVQHNWLASAVSAAQFAEDSEGVRGHDVEFFKVKGVRPGGELYAVALCGQLPGEPLRTVAVAAGTDEAHSLAQRLISAEETAESWHREYLIAEATAEKWHNEFQKAQGLAEELHDRYVLSLNEVYDSVSWRVTKPLRRGAEYLRRRRG